MVATRRASRGKTVAAGTREAIGTPPSGRRSIAALVRTLGGGKAVAQAVGVTPQAVSNWLAADKVPVRHHGTLWRLAQQRGIDWTPPGFEGCRLVQASIPPHEADDTRRRMFTQCSAAREVA